MKTESSSKKTEVVQKDKFYDAREPRYFAWPQELFIELVLSPEQTQKVLRWVKEGHSIIPFWSVNCERILWVDQDSFEEWIRSKNHE